MQTSQTIFSSVLLLIILSLSCSKDPAGPASEDPAAQTDISFHMLNTLGDDTAFINENVTIIASYHNETRDIVKIQWFDGENDSLLRSTRPLPEYSSDRLHISWGTPSKKTIVVEMTDEDSTVVRKSVEVFIITKEQQSETDISFHMLNTLGDDTAYVDDTVAIIATYSNDPRTIVKIKWFDGENDSPVRTAEPMHMSGKDTLRISWNDASVKTVYIEMTDERDSTYQGNVQVIIKENSIPTIVSISASTSKSHSLLLDSDGTLWGCGANGSGELGNSDGSYRTTPVKIMDNVKSASAGAHHSLIVKTDGTLWACGANNYGQLGNGTTTGHKIPIQVMDNVESASAGGSHSVVLKTDGTVWTFGYNNHGQLGVGTTDSRKIPVNIMNGVKNVFAGEDRSYMLTTDGMLRGCGWNTNGRLGDGTTTDRLTPVSIMNNIKNVAAGDLHTLFLKNDGTLWACSDGGYGQLGDGTRANHITPIPVMDDVQSASAGRNHSLVIRNDGTLWVCGANGGALGDGNTANRSILTRIMDNVQSVSAGGNFSLILRNDGTAWACGQNGYGQLGNGTTENSLYPVQVFSDKKREIMTGPFEEYTIDFSVDAGNDTLIPPGDTVHLHGVRVPGTREIATWEWKIGDGAWNETSGPDTFFIATFELRSNRLQTVVCSLKVTDVNGYVASDVVNIRPLPQIESIAAGDYHSLILDKTIISQNGTLWACGRNTNGQIGKSDEVGIVESSIIFTNRMWLHTDIKNIAAGGAHSLILRTDNSLYGCGMNCFGQLGIGTDCGGNIAGEWRSTWQALDNYQSKYVEITKNVQFMAAGGFHSLILKTDGTLWTCGDNIFGQLGDGTTTRHSSPVQVMTDVQTMAAGNDHSLIIKNDGTLWTCGSNEFGQLGDGTVIDRHTPVQIMTDVRNAEGGGSHSLIVTNDGTLWACGKNEFGQLGDGTFTDRKIPVRITDDVLKVEAGYWHSLILKTDGSLWSCGRNLYGELGNGTTTAGTTPVRIMSDVRSMAAGFGFSLVLKTDGTLWGFGDNSSRQITESQQISITDPLQIIIPE